MTARPRVAGIGELLWDRFPDGDRLGGATANFAFHAAQLGADAQIVSRVGCDSDGDRLLAALQGKGLATTFVQHDSSHPTGLVRVKLRQGQPDYLIESPAAWDFLEMSDDLVRLIASLDALCFGTLAQRHTISRQTVRALVGLCAKSTLRNFDVNLRQSFFSGETIEFGLTHASALKLNGDELLQVATLLGWSTDGPSIIRRIFAHFPIQVIAVTHGAEGCEIHTRKESVRAPAPQITCVDTVGAGDAFSAALVTGLLAGLPLEKIAQGANRIGAFVAGQAGAMPKHPQSILPYE